jgi:hypothetical protein
MSLPLVAALVRNLITVPAAVLRARAAKDAEVLVLRDENAVPRRQIARVRYEQPTGSGWRPSPGGSLASAGARSSRSPRPPCCADIVNSLPESEHSPNAGSPSRPPSGPTRLTPPRTSRPEAKSYI